MDIKRTVIALLAAAVLLSGLAGCMTHTHVVGGGPSSGVEETEAQWYALWGLVPLNEVDSTEMAGDATDYTVVTEISPLDALINFITLYVSIVRRSVTVIK